MTTAVSHGLWWLCPTQRHTDICALQWVGNPKSVPCPLSWGIWTPTVHGAHPKSTSKPHLDQFIRFLRGLRLCPTCLDRPQYIINNRPHVVLCTARWLRSKNYTHTHTHTHTHLMAICPRLPGWPGTRKVKPIWILLKQETVSGSGISWAVCKSALRSTDNHASTPSHHSVFCPSCCPTNSVKVLKAFSSKNY